jgi:hypothetical protein
MLKAGLHRELQTATLAGEIKDTESCTSPLVFVSRGAELLKRTRKGACFDFLKHALLDS